MKRPLVTIALPVFNGEDFLAQAVECLLKQDYDHFELIILDNCSTDATERMCSSFCEQDRRVRYYRHPRNLGALPNFNSAIRFAQGEFFMFAAHDDFWEPNFLKELVPLLLHDETLGLAFSGLDFVDENGRASECKEIPPRLCGAHSHFLNFLNYSVRFDYDYIVYGLYRTEALKQALPFQTVGGGLRYSTALFLFRFLTFAKAAGSRKVLFHYRVRSRASDLNDDNRLRWLLSYGRSLFYFYPLLCATIRDSSFSFSQKLSLCLICLVVIGFRFLLFAVVNVLPRTRRRRIKNSLRRALAKASKSLPGKRRGEG